MIKPKEHENCKDCPLYKTGVPVDDKLPTDLRNWSKLAVVGEMPGKAEVEGGFPFMGPSGRFLWNIFGSSQIKEDELFVTNSIKCGLPGGKKPKSKAMAKAQSRCKDLIIHNLKELHAKVVLCTGKYPWEALSGHKGIEKYRGIIIPRGEEYPFHLTCTLHPAALLRKSEKRIFVEMMHSDIEKAYALARGKIKVWEPSVYDATDISALIPWLKKVLKEKITVACDVETDGIDALTCNLLTVGLAAMEPWPVSYSIPWQPAEQFGDMKFYSEKEWKEIESLLKKILEDKKMKVVFHNKPYDVPVLQRHLEIEMTCERHDTLLMHHALYPRLPHDLQSVGSHFLPIEAWKTNFQSSSDSFFKEISREDDEEKVQHLVHEHISELLWYNAGDSAVTIEAYYKMDKELDVLGVRKVYEHDRKKCDLSIDWYWNGIGIDLNKRKVLEKRFLKELYSHKKGLKELCGLPSVKDFESDIAQVNESLNESRKERNALRRAKRKDPDSFPKDSEDDLSLLERHCDELDKDRTRLMKIPCWETFNPNSPDQLREAVVKGRGLTPEKVTKGGADGENKKLSTSKDSLWNLRDDEFVGRLFDYRESSYQYSHYVKNMHNLIHDDGRLHSVWKLHSTPSGRFGTKPAVQNWTKAMSEMMIASPGCKFIGADYAALELRILALLAGQEDLIEAFNNDEDRHSLHAEWFFGDLFLKADADLKKELRGRGKNVTFGKNYGAGPETLYDQIREKRPDVRTKEEQKQLKREVKHMSAILDNNYPNHLALSRWINQQAQDNYRIFTPRLGRCRKWPMGDVTPTEPPNHLIQGSAADIMDEATFRFVDALKERGWYQTRVWIVLQIHDSLKVECEEEIVEEVRVLLEECMYYEWTIVSPVTGKENTIKLPAEAKIGDRISDVF